jgi:predicted transcriptional regulator
MIPKQAKDSTLRIRVPSAIKQQIVTLAAGRGEGESVIVREALALYLARHDATYTRGIGAVLPHAERTRVDPSVNEPPQGYGDPNPDTHNLAPAEAEEQAHVVRLLADSRTKKDFAPPRPTPAPRTKSDAGVAGSL